MQSARMPGAGAVACCLLAGVAVVQWFPRLPSTTACLALGLAAAGLALRWPGTRAIAIVLAGVAWASWRGALALDAQLPRDFGWRDFEVVGTVAGLPEARGDATRFAFDIARAELDGRVTGIHGRVRLAWYRQAPALAPCARWHLRLRLHRPRALLDPGSADAERSALERRVVAVGYVRASPANRSLGTADGFCLDGLRGRIARALARTLADAHDAALLQALGVGDTRGLTAGDWRVARATGVSHLLAISGFHVGVAALFGTLLVRLLYGLCPGCALRLPRSIPEAAAALLAAGGYAALAGFGLPTVRTLLMIAVLTLARCARRRPGGLQGLALALIALLVVDPLAVLAAGFWLSFAGVALLMLCLEGGARDWRERARGLLAAQALMSIALLPLTVWFFGQVAPVGALANLLAVPVVSLVVVPALLGGIVLLPVCPAVAGPLLRVAGACMHATWWLLAHMAHWPVAHRYLPEAGALAMALATIGAIWLFAPRGMPLRWLGLLLFLPLLRPPERSPSPGGFQAWVLDVGQGLAVVVRTRHHALVYDTGARYPSGFDLGEAVVVPALHALGIGRVDLIVVSHADNDHAGGARAVAEAFPDAQRLAGEPARMAVPFRPCRAGQRWRWDGVRVRVLSPAAGAAGSRNDRSCVLAIEGEAGRLLLTGDIGSGAEPAVAEAAGSGPPTVLLVPHHGSRHSSSPSFIAAVAPVLAVVSAGWHNRFGHPHPATRARYAAAGVPLLGTATRGAIELEFPAGGPPRTGPTWRQRHRRYWRE